MYTCIFYTNNYYIMLYKGLGTMDNYFNNITCISYYRQ